MAHIGIRSRSQGIAMALLLALGCGSPESSDSAAQEQHSPGDFNSAAARPSADLAANGGGSNGGTATPQPSAEPAEPGAEEVQEQATAQAPPFVLAQSDPFATFAADVDTASYDIFRRSLLGGALPHPSNVRLEEFLNYFNYAYPEPDLEDPAPFHISLAATPNFASPQTKLLRIGISGAVPTSRPAANLVFLVDVSGSMAAENKLPLVKVVLREMLSELEADDLVSIVTYAGDTAVRLPPTKASERATIESAIAGLTTGGGTAGGAGIQLAYEQAHAGMIEGGINHVLLCTDGDFNVGIVDSNELVSLIETSRQQGVTLTALGVGDRNNDAMMERVTNAGNGVYSVLYNEDQAVHYAHTRLLSSMVHIAKDMKIQVEWNPAQVYGYRLLGYENRLVADDEFRDDRVDGGEVGAGHRVTALFEIITNEEDLPEGAEVSAGDPVAESVAREVTAEELVRVKVRYEPPGSDESAEANEVFSALGATDVASSFRDCDADTRWAVGVATFAQWLRGDEDSQNLSLEALRAELAPLANEGADPARREFLSLFDRAVALDR